MPGLDSIGVHPVPRCKHHRPKKTQTILKMARNYNSINQSKGKNSAHAGCCFCRLMFFRSVLENSKYTVSSFMHCFSNFLTFPIT